MYVAIDVRCLIIEATCHTHTTLNSVRRRTMDCATVKPFLASLLSLVFFILASSAQLTPPTLAKRLRESYTINPSLSPLFTRCAFDGYPSPTISWMLNSTLLPTENQRRPSGPFYTTEGVLNLGKATVGDSGIYTCVGTNILGHISESTSITIVTGQATLVWIRWWMLFVYAIGLWFLLAVFLVFYYIYRRCTTKAPRRKVPRHTQAKANIEDYSCYDDETDPSPRYTFSNPHADDEGLPTTFNIPFHDQTSREATGYLNPAFQATMSQY